MNRAIRIHGFGGPEVLELEDVEVGLPGAGQVRVKHDAVGLNMVDTYYRTGLYPLELPSGLGSEAAGVVTALGPGAEGLKVGDRIAYASPPPLDAYSEERLIDARWVIALPGQIGSETAAAMMLKGLTAWYLLKRSYSVQQGDWILLYAAAGGVGLIASQWAKLLGARVIGVVGDERKREIAREHGSDEIILAHEDIAARVREITGGGVHAVYDSIGKDTFYQSLDSLRPHGVMVSFGNASGPVAPFAPLELAKRGSLYVTRPTLFDFIRERSELLAAADELVAVVAGGSVRIEVGQRYALADAARAQRDLEQRRTTGSTVLLP